MRDSRKTLAIIFCLTFGFHLFNGFFVVTNPNVFILRDILLRAGLPIISVFWLYRYHPNTFNEILSEIKLNNSNAWVLIPAFILGFIYVHLLWEYQPVLHISLKNQLGNLGLANYAEHLAPQTTNIENLLLASNGMRDLWLFYLSATAAITEELFYNAILIRVMFTKQSRFLAFVVLSSILFGIVHFEQGLTNVIIQSGLHLFLASYYFWMRRLLPLMFFHFTVDVLFLFQG